MHWQDLLDGSRLFYKNEPFARFYLEYMKNKNWRSWESPEVTGTEVGKLFDFVNQWRTHVPRGREQEEGFKTAYRKTYPLLQLLKAEKLERVDFKRQIFGLIKIIRYICE